MADQQFYTLITTAGKAKIANATAFGTKVNFNTLKVGDGNGNYYEPTESKTDLVHTVWSGPITSISTDPSNPNWIIIAVSIPADVGGFMIREVGIFDDTGTMIAIGKYPETYKPTSETGSTKDLTIKTILEVSNSGTIELKVDPNIIVATKQDFNALAGTGRTTETVKKNADNIASLGSQMADITNYSAKKDAGIVVGSGTGNGSKLNALLSLIGSNIASISFGKGKYRIDDNVTIPKNITVKLDDGAYFVVDDDKTFTVGEINASRRQIFAYNATNTDITTSNIKLVRKYKVYPEWWGALTNDSSFDCRPSFKRMYASCQQGAVVSLNTGTYYINDEIDPTYNDWSFQGEGIYFPTEAHKISSWGDNINFGFSAISFNNVKSNTHMLQFQPIPGGTGMIRNVEIKNIAFYGLDGTQNNLIVTTGQKTMTVDFTGTNCNGIILASPANKMENVFVRGFSGVGIQDATFSKYTNVMVEFCGVGIQSDATDSVFTDTHIYVCKNGLIAGLNNSAHYLQLNTMRIEWCEEFGIQYLSGGNFHFYGLTIDACGYAGIAICSNNIDAGGTITNRNYLEALVTRCGRSKNGLSVSSLTTETDLMQGSNVYINKWFGGNLKITSDRKTDDSGNGVSPTVGIRFRNSGNLLIEHIANNFTAASGNYPAIKHTGLTQSVYRSTGILGSGVAGNESMYTFDSSGNVATKLDENFSTYLINDGYTFNYRGKIIPQGVGTESATSAQFAVPVHYGTPANVDNGTMYWNSLTKAFYGCSEGAIEQLLGAREIATLPTADSAHHWKMYKIDGGGTAEDSINICLRHADGNYYWKTL